MVKDGTLELRSEVHEVHEVHTHTDTQTHGQEHVLENGPEKRFFLLFSNYMFLES